jgi:hypothetical protein
MELPTSCGCIAVRCMEGRRVGEEVGAMPGAVAGRRCGVLALTLTLTLTLTDLRVDDRDVRRGRVDQIGRGGRRQRP